MITKHEIMTHAKALALMPNIIEKDYVLNWILAGISSRAELSDTWVFKGGTCLKKCYFEEYRFSEDLDFTLINEEHINQNYLISVFHSISEWIYDRTGIELPQQLIHFEVYTNPRGNLSIEGRISYRGPLHRRGNLSRIKLDLTTDEKLVLPPELRNVYHPYSDLPNEDISIQAYCLEEIFAEKMRALIERLRPRDLFDVIHLHNHYRSKVDLKKLISSLKIKCSYKNVMLPSIELLTKKEKKRELVAEWENMLAHQISNLRPFEYYWEQLPHLLDWLYTSK